MRRMRCGHEFESVAIATGAVQNALGRINAALRPLVEFCVIAHNEVMPHSAIQGQTPDEVFFCIGNEVTEKLAVARKSARENRMEENRNARCGICVGETSSGALLMQRPRTRML